MKRRRPMSKSYSKKLFSKKAVYTPKINTAPTPMRGGIRL